MTCTKVSSQYISFLQILKQIWKQNQMSMKWHNWEVKAAASSAKKDGLVTEVFLRQVESRPRLVSQVHHLTHQVTSLSLSSSSPPTHYPTTLFSTPLWLSWAQFHLLISPDPAFLPWMSEPAVRAHRLQPLPRICKVWDIMSLEVWWWWWCDNMVMMI